MSDSKTTLKSVICDEWLRGMVELAAETPAGCFVEVGVYQGGSALHLYRLAQQQARALHLFDTFTGIPVKGEFDRHNIGDFKDADLASIQAAMPDATYHVGIFPDTLQGPLGNEVQSIAFLHSDVDQYQSQKAVNEFLWPRVVPGGVMMIDDYFLLDGIRKAIDEDFPNRLFRYGNGRPFVEKQR